MQEPNRNPPPNFSTLVEALRWRATHQAAQPAYTFLADGETDEQRLTYAELDQAAGAIAVTEVATKMVLYYLHERTWSCIGWGVAK